MRKNVRAVAAALYRLAKPLARPLAFRLRAYMTRPLIEQLHAEKLQSLALQEQIFRDLTGQTANLAGQIERLKQDQAVLTRHLIQEIQFSREFLQRTIYRVDEEFRTQDLRDLEDRLKRIESYGYTAARRVAVSCGDDSVMIRTAVGYVICPASDHALISLLVESGDLEPGTRALIQKILRPGQTFLDIGANVGMHTLAAAQAMHKRGRIVAFEPSPETHSLLSKSVWINGLAHMTETHQAAVSDRPGEQQLHLGATSGHHSLYRLDSGEPEHGLVHVPVVRVDDVIESGAPVDLMKIDVEGAELEVLAGAVSTIRHNPNAALIVELGVSHLVRTGHTIRSWLAAFQELGFVFKAIHPESGQLLEWGETELQAVPSINLLFARPSHPAWVHTEGAI